MGKRIKSAVLLAILIGSAGQAFAAKPVAPAAITSDEPPTRIRGVPLDARLTKEQFSGWMRTVWRKGKDRRYAAIGSAAAPRTTSEEFDRADANGDGRITKEELADYLALPDTN